MQTYQVGGCDIRQLHSVLAEMMDAVDSLCQEHHIRYVLSHGSMLGAVRHQGFIPWDDDLDIMMPRADYDRFVKIANEQLGERYFFECQENTPDYPYSFGKLRRNGTVYVESFTRKLKIRHCVYIDVFPMDFVDNTRPEQMARIRKWISHYTQLRYAKLGLIPRRFRYLPFLIFPKSFFDRQADRLMRSCPASDSMQELSHYSPRKPVISAGLFENIIRVPFEGYRFNIPRDYDAYLRGSYGEYMQLPPREKQGPTHCIEEVRL